MKYVFSVKLFLVLFFQLLVLQPIYSNGLTRISYKEINCIKFVYIKEGVETSDAIEECIEIFEMDKRLLLDTLITDRIIFKRISKEINRFEIADITPNYDFRIKCYIKMNNGDLFDICLGYNHLILYNGIEVKDRSRLFKIINNIIICSV